MLFTTRYISSAIIMISLFDLTITLGTVLLIFNYGIYLIDLFFQFYQEVLINIIKLVRNYYLTDNYSLTIFLNLNSHI